MKLHVLSDLHLEFEPFVPQKTEAEVVVLAGDIHIGTKGIAWVKENFSSTPVVYIPGNHEYYGQTIPDYIKKLKGKALGTNIYILEQDTLVLGDTVFLGCTLWTDFELFGNPRVAGYYATQSMTDYRKIRVSPSYSRLQSVDTAGINYRSLRWLGEQLDKYRGARIVIVTHHSPSPQSLPANYEDDILSAAFASNMDEFVEHSGACLWVHGHIHLKQDYYIGTTRVICNPRGYPGEQNTGFSPALILSV